MSLTVIDLKGNNKGNEPVPACLSVEKINQGLIWEVVTAAQANLRQGTHKTKVKGEVSGGGIKPWKQKGTGRARAGSNRSPLWKGGGTVFGPQPRDYRKDISTKKRNAAFKNILAEKISANKLVLVDELKFDSVSTSAAFEGISNVLGKAPFFPEYTVNRKLRKKTNDKHRNITIIFDGKDKNVKLSIRNIPWVSLVSVDRIAALPLYYNHGLIISKSAFSEMIKRFEK